MNAIACKTSNIQSKREASYRDTIVPHCNKMRATYNIGIHCHVSVRQVEMITAAFSVIVQIKRQMMTY